MKGQSSGHDIVIHFDTSNERTIRKMIVCGRCADIVGPVDAKVRVQRGTCPEHSFEEEDTWSRFDFNRLLDLCQCCGAEALRSGGKFATWFCPECHSAVGELNGRLGRYAVPIGRHSFHAGAVMRSEDLSDPIMTRTFVNQWESISSSISTLRDWGQVAVRKNYEALGWYPNARILLKRYLRESTRIDKAQRFREMCKYFTSKERQQ